MILVLVSEFMSKIVEKKRLKQQAILIAAQQEFLSCGFMNGNMDKIAEQAGVTKQTVYRYFSSKVELFKATLTFMGEQSHFKYFEYLQLEDNDEALQKFAIGLIDAHLTDEHLATYRLLISECINEPEIINHFFSQGPDDTKDKLNAFFEQKLKISQSDIAIELWTAMLLSIRHNALLAKAKPRKEDIESHVNECNRWLLRSFGEN